MVISFFCVSLPQGINKWQFRVQARCINFFVFLPIPPYRHAQHAYIASFFFWVFLRVLMILSIPSFEMYTMKTSFSVNKQYYPPPPLDGPPPHWEGPGQAPAPPTRADQGRPGVLVPLQVGVADQMIFLGPTRIFQLETACRNRLNYNPLRFLPIEILRS